MAVTDPRLFCVTCGRIVDPRGADERLYCFCRCGWPVYGAIRGCGARIFFQINVNEKRQPFDLETGKAHHGTCSAFIEWKRLQREAERAARKAASAPPPKNPHVTLEEFL